MGHLHVQRHASIQEYILICSHSGSMIKDINLHHYLQDLTTTSHTLDHHEELLVFCLLYESGQAFVLKVTSHHEHRKSENNYPSLTALWHISVKTQVLIFHREKQCNYPNQYSLILQAKASNET